MGSCFSSDAPPNPEDTDVAKKEEDSSKNKKTTSEQAQLPAASNEETTKEKPKPMLFAIMRNGHEVIRGGMRDLTSAVDRCVDLGLVARQWKDLLKWTRLHAAMEEGTTTGNGTTPKGFFRYV